MHWWSIPKVHATKKYPYGMWLHNVYRFSGFSEHGTRKAGSGTGFDRKVTTEIPDHGARPSVRGSSIKGRWTVS